ncbi:MAG TPA: hypothetical protein VK623_04505 [Flavobacterium sp.]|nr:hypothetical protein [Flavobacterium sp.]
MKPFQSVSVDTMITGKMSVRAILTDENKVWYAADEGRFGFYDFTDNTTFEKRIVFDTLKPEFRSIAKTSRSIFIINAGSPALLYQIDKQNHKSKLVYRETDKKAFYDSMQFWNDNEGIAIGDPVENCLSVLITRDGGNSWSKIPCENLPKTIDGEAAFAASNSNVILKGNMAWVISGGKKSRVFYSPDKGNNWQVFETPIVQGSAMTGTFTGDFYDEKTGFIAGGDYEKPNQDYGNKAISDDGGKTWKLVAENIGFGYASCAQFVPKSDGKEIVCVGISGLYYSADSGLSWKKLLDDKTLYTIRFLNENTAFAAGKNKIIRISFKK